MKTLLSIVSTLLIAASANAAVMYAQPFDGTGRLVQSSRMAAHSNSQDAYVWDAFVLPMDTTITEIQWRGGFLAEGRIGGPVVDFTVAIYMLSGVGAAPDFDQPPMITYQTRGLLQQKKFGTVGRNVLFDYVFELPRPFEAMANTQYWLQIYAWHDGLPDWGIATSDIGDGTYYSQRIRSSLELVRGDTMFSIIGVRPKHVMGDFNNDGVADGQDRAMFCDMLGAVAGDPNFMVAADFNHDRVIDQLDQAIFNRLLPFCGADIVSSDTLLPPGDGVVNGADLAYLLNAWGEGPSCADMVSRSLGAFPDGKVNGVDLAFLLNAWGACK